VLRALVAAWKAARFAAQNEIVMERANASRFWTLLPLASAIVLGIMLGTLSVSRAAVFHVELRQPGLTSVAAAKLLHTLANDLFVESDGTVYVRTGDIPAMWLRDSSAQLEPYVRFTGQVPSLRPWFRAVIERNARNIVADPYANAFRADYGVWERKWEVDSLAYPLLFARSYWLATHDRTIFSMEFHQMLSLTVATYECEERHFACSTYHRNDLSPVTRGGGASDTGLIWCGFRPSDDPTTRPFNIPQEMFATVALRELADLARVGYADHALATRALALSARVHAGIERYGRFYDFRYSWIYVYETDGRGDVRLMDDANIPNLLAAPLYGYVLQSSPIYANTRRFVLSRANPYFFEGRAVSGIGSPHTPERWVWPLAIATRAMTAGNRMEVAQQLAMLAATRGTSGTIPESVNADDPSLFTRAEFGWANATYADLLFRTASTFRGLPAPNAMRWLDHDRTPMPALVAGLTALENDAAIVSALKRLFPTTPILNAVALASR
jgi:meiotically up-regulated gene 157 (Mug157) protein